MAHDGNPQAEVHDVDHDSIGNDPEDLELLQAQPGRVTWNAPQPVQRLNRLDVICIICNRTIGMLKIFFIMR